MKDFLKDLGEIKKLIVQEILVLNYIKIKVKKITWEQCWEAISKEYPDVQSQSEVLDNTDKDNELEIQRVINQLRETQEIVSWHNDYWHIYFNAATLFYNNKPKFILDAWELLDKKLQ